MAVEKDIRLQNEVMRHPKWLKLRSLKYVTWPQELDADRDSSDPDRLLNSILRARHSLAVAETRLGLINLWLWAAEHAHLGHIRGVTAAELAEAAGVSRPTAYTFLDHLVECDWIAVTPLAPDPGEEVTSEQSFEQQRYDVTLHDWHEHQPYLIQRDARVKRAKKGAKAAAAKRKQAAKAKKKAAAGGTRKQSSKEVPTPIAPTSTPRSTSEGGGVGEERSAPQPSPELHPSGSAPAASQPGDWTAEEMIRTVHQMSDPLAFDLPAEDDHAHAAWITALNTAIAQEDDPPPPREILALVQSAAGQNWRGRIASPHDLYAATRDLVARRSRSAPISHDPLRDPPEAWGTRGP
jgi:hypothetical protein